jgi:drug/metabolite transporter (DMT)-like permease
MAPGIGFAVAAALVWGVYLFVLKRSFDGFPATVLIVYANGFALVWYTPVLLASVGVDGTRTAIAGLDSSQLALLVLTAVMTAAAVVSFIRALDVGEVSYVAPISKIVPVFVLPIEVLLLQQVLQPLQIAGVVVATVAVYVANFRGGSLAAPIRRAATSRAAQLAVLSAACFAVGDVAKRVALQELAIPSALWVPLLLGCVLVIVLPIAIRSHPETVRDDLPKLVALGAIVALGEYLTTLAFAVIPASIASPIVNTQAIVAVLLGGVLLDEQYFGTRLVAALLAIIGVTMIAL